MTASRQNLTSRQHKAILALLHAPTIEKAAELAGVGQASVYRWLRQDRFRQAYQAARRDFVSRAMAQLQKASAGAADVLTQLMESDNTPASVRMSAARCLLEMALKSLESEDLTERINVLEKQLIQGGCGTWRR